MAKELLQYNIDYDRGENPQFTTIQLETHLRERFHVLLSQVEYGIVNGRLVRQGKTEPFLNSIIRGRDIMKRLATNPEDFDREDAEVKGFGEVIDPFLSNSETPLGTKILSISPPGGKYKHNFYDIFTLKRRNGARYVELSRYSSGLIPADYAKLIPEMDPDGPLTAAEFLANPIKIRDVFVSAEQIHRVLHKEHDYMEESDFGEIWSGVQPAVANYLLNRNANSFNAILNLADKVWDSQKRRKAGESYTDYTNYVPTNARLRDLGNEPVRQAGGDCPGKSGADDPYSVSESGEKRILCCTCPFCEQQVEAIIEDGKITCPKCKKSAPWKEKKAA